MVKIWRAISPFLSDRVTYKLQYVAKTIKIVYVYTPIMIWYSYAQYG